MKRLIIAGSRNGFDPDRFLEEINRWVAIHGKPDVVLCGEAKGVDTMGKTWAMWRAIRVESYPADWDQHGRSAGPKRNLQMAENADAAIIFAPDGSRGSDNMESCARRLRLTVVRIKE